MYHHLAKTVLEKQIIKPINKTYSCVALKFSGLQIKSDFYIRIRVHFIEMFGSFCSIRENFDQF
jgi:hypothetical protein